MCSGTRKSKKRRHANFAKPTSQVTCMVSQVSPHFVVSLPSTGTFIDRAYQAQGRHSFVKRLDDQYRCQSWRGLSRQGADLR